MLKDVALLVSAWIEIASSPTDDSAVDSRTPRECVD